MLRVPKQVPSSKVGNKLKQYINAPLREIHRKETKIIPLVIKRIHIYLTNIKDSIHN